MIKSVSIQNFEAHEDTTVEFGDGMNSIVGLSNSGKSAIIRALMVVVDNEWSKEMVRTGYEFCRVKVETERGWVEAERGEKVNRWRCKEGDEEIQSFQKVGTSVPELATRILGMGKRDRGNGISELPNFQTQLEKHYMLAEVGDKKATSNMIAVMMDNAIGLGGMEDLIKDFSADLLKDRKWLNEKQQEIVDLKSDIVDESIFSQYEKDVDRMGELHGAVDTMDSDIATADVYLGKYSDCKAKKDDAESNANAIPDTGAMNELVEEIGTIDGGLSLAERAFSIEENLAKAGVLAGIDADSLAIVSDRYDLLCRTIRNSERVIEMEDGLAKAGTVIGVNTNTMEELESEIGGLEERIQDAESRLENARDVWKRQSNAQKEAKALAVELRNAESDFDSLKDELGVCPLCGNKLK